MSRTGEHAPRHAAEHRGARRPARRRGAPRHAAAVPARDRSTIGARGLLSVTGLLAVGTVVVLTGTGGTFALWTQSQAVGGPTITSGSTGLTIDGATDLLLTDLRLTSLAPGTSAVAPLTLRNTGTTPLGVRVAGTDIPAETNGLASSLAASVTPSASCTARLPGAQDAPLAGFATEPLASLAPGEELPVCLEVRLDPAAPSSVQGGSADFVMTFEATQERPR